MKEQHKTPGAVRRAATATTLAWLATALSVGTAQAVPARNDHPLRASVAVVDQVLTIRGTSGADRVTVDFTALDSIAVDLGRGVQRFDPRTFGSVSAFLGSGDDRLRTVSGGALVDRPLSVQAGSGDDDVLGGAAADTLVGGSGDDHLLGGAGTDLVVGGRGDDDVDGGVGTDTELLGQGDDTAEWDPGEGNDAVTGGSGSDTLLFRGSDADERMSLAADGTRAVFLRSPGSIRMDLDEVERLQLRTFAGADAVTIGDLTGTGLTAADIDLAPSSGADSKPDTVVLTGTGASDEVAVAARAGAVDVTGLPVRTTVRGAQPADRLDIDTLDGNDRISVDPAVDALITVALDLGAGQL